MKLNKTKKFSFHLLFINHNYSNELFIWPTRVFPYGETTSIWLLLGGLLDCKTITRFQTLHPRHDFNLARD